MTGWEAERGLRIDDAAQRSDLGVFVERTLRLDEAAVVRLKVRGDGLIGAWTATGFDVLACRVIAGTLRPPDVTCGADRLRAGLLRPGGGAVDIGMPMDSAWRGALPPETGFGHVDDVPAADISRLARRGVDLAREHSGPQGPPPSLLDQQVLEVSGAGETVGIPMRCVLALAGLGFLLDPAPAGEVVRVRSTATWLRLDARFGSVFRRRQNVALTIESAAISR